jgi:hypothetical protein
MYDWQVLPGQVATSAGPSWAAGPSHTYLAYKGEGSDTIFVARTATALPDSFGLYDFDQLVEVANANTSAAPAITYWSGLNNNGTVFLAWKGAHDNLIWWATSTPDGATWTVQGSLPPSSDIITRTGRIWASESKHPAVANVLQGRAPSFQGLDWAVCIIDTNGQHNHLSIPLIRPGNHTRQICADVRSSACWAMASHSLCPYVAIL